MSKKVRTILSGMGNVNRRLLQILEKKQSFLRESCGLDFMIVGAADSSGCAFCGNGFEAAALQSFKTQGGRLAELEEGCSESLVTRLCETDADLLFEGTPVNLETGNPGLPVVRAALEKGMQVVLANKSPLVLDYAGIHALAAQNGVSVAFSATVCGSLPIINLGRRDLIAADILTLRGVFNSTSNFVLTEMEAGRSLEEALREAQRRGIAEADPKLDIEGWDTACKLIIIANAVLRMDAHLPDIRVRGMTDVTREDLAKASEKGMTIRLLGQASRTSDGYSLAVSPVEIRRDGFLGRCTGWQMGVEIRSDIYGRICFKNTDTEPLPTAAAMLRDAVNLFS